MKARSLAKAMYEDLLRVPENLVAELIDGELYAWPRPRGVHICARSKDFLTRSREDTKERSKP